MVRNTLLCFLASSREVAENVGVGAKCSIGVEDDVIGLCLLVEVCSGDEVAFEGFADDGAVLIGVCCVVVCLHREVCRCIDDAYCAFIGIDA